MKNKTRIVIVDDNIEFLDVMRRYLMKREGFEIVGTAADGLEAVNIIKETEPDLVILDIMMPKLDGLGVLEKREWSCAKKTQYIVTSAIGNYRISQLALRLGAEYFMIKPFDFEDLVTRIYQLSNTKNGSYDTYPARTDKAISIKNDTSIEESIANILDSVGMPSNLKGYTYIKYAAQMVVKDLTLICALASSVYAETANAYMTTYSRVERAIRNAIETTWTRGDMNKIQSIFNYQIGEKRTRPTNSEFIMMIANKIIDKSPTFS